MEANDLKSALNSTDVKARKNAAEEIGEMAKNKNVDETLFAPLADLLSDENSEVQSSVSLALFWMAHNGGVDQQVLPQIVENLRSPDGMIRHDMAGVLESFAQKDLVDPSAIPLLEENLNHENPHTRAATIYCLGTLSEKGAANDGLMNKIKTFLDDDDEGVRDAVQRVLN